jgi:biotin operon repressor
MRWGGHLGCPSAAGRAVEAMECPKCSGTLIYRRGGRRPPLLRLEVNRVPGDREIAELVWRELQASARGRGRAVSAVVLGARLGISQRVLRAAVNELRNLGKPVGSAVEAPAGYYVPETREEALECSAHLWARVREIARVARAFDQAAARLGVRRQRAEQIRLVFGGDEGELCAG